jgi:hypothetical protein
MRTWTPVAGFPSNETTGFWQNPFNGSLLTMTSDGFVNDELFWSSSDGAHWNALPAPPFPFAVFDIVVQQPFTDAPWRICGGDTANWYINGQHNTHQFDIACTPDAGGHWVMRHLDTVMNGPVPYTLIAIADDGGALLTTSAGLARFAVGSGGVDALGSVPNAGTLVYAASAGAGVLWSGPANNSPDADAQGRIFTASYA